MSEATEQSVSAKEALDRAVDAAYLAEGYITDDGHRSHGAVADAIYPLIEAAFVAAPAERVSKAVTREALYEAAFPSFPRREDWPSTPDPELTKETHAALWAKVWDLAKADRSGVVQQLVGFRTPDRILCRVKLGSAGNDAAYVTDNLACIKDDFADPLARAMERANRKMSLNMAMAGGRMPEHAKAFDRIYRQANKKALTEGLNDTKLMLEASNGDDVVDHGDGDE